MAEFFVQCVVEVAGQLLSELIFLDHDGNPRIWRILAAIAVFAFCVGLLILVFRLP
jgi:hypothetical protein